VYCRSGVRSAKACQMMGSQGFEKLYNLDGGILEWTGNVE
jgi:rhodanese-related sulfurtransferase